MDGASAPAGVPVWWFRDTRPGHENQSQGLIQALRDLFPVRVWELAVEPGPLAGWHWLAGRYPPGRDLPDPALILGAGHATHLPMLAARRARGGRVVVLMQPSLPCRWFDLCVIPAHDDPPSAANVLTTRGVLNRVRASGDKDPDLGLILIGGPSRHHGWPEAALRERVRSLLEREPRRRWRMTTSRRTPGSWLAGMAPLREAFGERLEIHAWEDTGPDWLPAQLDRAAVVWVTADSVSMVYEALTSEAAVGVLPVTEKGAGRVSRGLHELIAAGWVADFGDWLDSGRYPAPRRGFNEARRTAQWIQERWLSER